MPGNNRLRSVGADDGIYNSLSAAEKTILTLATSTTGGEYSGVINLAVAVG